MPVKRRYRWLCLVIVLLATVLRFTQLGHESLWTDEGYTAILLRRHSIVELINGGALDRANPPLFYVVTKLVTSLLGMGEFQLRLVSALSGIGTVVVTGYLAWKMTRRVGIGMYSAIWTATSWYLVSYSQEARSYSLLIVLTVLFVACLYERRNRFMTGLIGILAIYTHYSFIAVLLACSVWLLVIHWRQWKTLFAAALPILITVVGFMYWFGISVYPTLISSNTNRLWQPNITWSSFSLFINKLLFIPTTATVVMTVATLTILGGLVVGSVWLHQRSEATVRSNLYLLWLIIIAPFVCFIAQGIWLDRYMLLVLPFIYILICWLIWPWPWLRGLLCLAVLISSIGWYGGYFSSLQKEDWKGATAAVARIDDGTGKIYISKSYNQYAWRYYYQGATNAKFPTAPTAEDVEKNMTNAPWVVIVYHESTDINNILIHSAERVFGKGTVQHLSNIDIYTYH
ncbi:MAG: glycosyltransferase family 39 protein [Candidatus Kerfeldbacteria bacterium]|nr:glycosyltransferase family 39 protein [Candidatus Kerfeldbacteria bacterium]